MLRPFAALSQRFRGRVDTEHEQALIRLVIVLLVLVYLFGLGMSSGFDQGTLRDTTAVILAETLIGLGLVVAIAFDHGISHARRLIGMVSDYATLALLMALHGRELAPLYIIFLWITIGNGLRFGQRYLHGAAAMACVAFAAMAMSTDYWRDNAYLAIGLVLGLMAIPLYLSSLMAEVVRANEEARRANESKSRFLAKISQEIRTPLNGIVGMTDLLATTRLNPEQRECTQVIQSSSNSLLLVIDDVLDIGALESGKLKRRESDFRPGDVVRSVATMLQPLAGEKGLRFDARVTSDVPVVVHGDGGHLRQVLVNLMHNAIRFTEQGLVELELGAVGVMGAGLRLRATVRDTGVGIPDSAKARIFESTLPAESARVERVGGLGTTIAKMLTELMGGQIGLDDNPGGGALFWVEVPVAPAQGPAEPVAAPAPGNIIAFDDPFVRHRARVRSLRVLLADDQPANQLVMRRMLEKGGHRIEAVSDGETFLDHLALGGFDLAVVDLHLPGMSGIDAIKQARFLEAGGKRTPFLGVSADTSAEIVREARQAGFHGVLSKPLVATQLLEALAEISAEGGAPKAAAVETTPVVAPGVVLDPTVLGELRSLNLGGEFVRTFSDQCLRDAARCLADIERAGARADWDAFRDACHALKGVAGNIGALSLAQATSDHLRPSRADLGRAWRGYLRQLEQHLDRVRAQLPQVLSALQADSSSENDHTSA